ncbi:MAG TPA: cytochrome b/b6 domain-containing protein [Nevskia sp.]|nr:cytochrome b/b6 domain-containing protein [Nevskia sp.]
MSAPISRFNPLARLLHWAMAAMILAMLFVGIGMVSTVSPLHSRLLELHKPLGVVILALVLLRLVVRVSTRTPPLPPDMAGWQKLAAHGSHWMLYGLMLAMPLVGWGMLSAGGYPLVFAGGLHLPAILPQDRALYAGLRRLHSWLGLLLFGTVMAHLAAALFHALIRRDGVFGSMRP